MSRPGGREGPSLRPAATFIWLEFQELKSNIPVGKRMARNPGSEVGGSVGVGGGSGSPEDMRMGGE